MKTHLYLLAFALLLAAAPARAADYVVLDRRATEFDSWQDRVDATYGTTVVSRQVNVPVTVLEEQRARTRLGYGGLMIANALATETGRSFDEIVALKQSGHGWGWIAKQNNVKLGPIVSRLNRADVEFKKAKVKVKDHGNGARTVKVKGTGHGNGNAFAHGNGGGRGMGHGKGHGGGHGKGKH